MKLKNYSIAIVSVALLFSAASLAQTAPIAIGMDYGLSIIQTSQLSLAVQEVETAGAIVPKNIRGRVEFALNPYTLVRVAGGYGSTEEKQESEATFSNGLKSSGEATFNSSGFLGEGALIYQVPIDDKSVFAVRFGLGAGYYSYNFKQKGFQEQVFGGQVAREEYEEPEVKIAGFAQSFIIGLMIGGNAKVSATVEVAKLGLSFMKMTQDIEETLIDPNTNQETKRKAGERKADFNASNGLEDLAITVGLNLNLGQ